MHTACFQGHLAELIRVLAYPKFKLGDDDQQELLADYLPWCTTVRIPNPPPVTPDCRDPFD
ncbi:MAG: PIN domain-containing protein [Thiobacillus sp.]